MDRTKKKHDFSVVLTSAAFAGLAEVAMTFPLDTIKTIIQANTQATYRSVLLDLYKNPLRSYKGGGTYFVQCMCKSSFRFGSFSLFSDTLENYVGREKYLENKLFYLACAGGMAGSAEAMLFTTYTERIKILMQFNKDAEKGSHYRTTYSTVSHVYRTQGLRGFSVGMVPTVLRQGSSTAFRFSLYLSLKKAICNIFGWDPEQENFRTKAIAGGIVGSLSVAINNPIDVMKSRIQSDKCKGSLEAFRSVYKKSGIKGFYAGLPIRSVRLFCSQAISFAVYETLCTHLDGVLSKNRLKQ